MSSLKCDIDYGKNDKNFDTLTTFSDKEKFFYAPLSGRQHIAMKDVVMYLVKEENVLEMSHRPLTLREKETAWL